MSSLGSGPLAPGFDVKRGRLSKWPKKDFELRPGGYAMMQRSLMTSQPVASQLGDKFTRGLSSGSAPVFRCPGIASEECILSIECNW